jgi:hypothetical protein
MGQHAQLGTLFDMYDMSAQRLGEHDAGKTEEAPISGPLLSKSASWTRQLRDSFRSSNIYYSSAKRAPGAGREESALT